MLSNTITLLSFDLVMHNFNMHNFMKEIMQSNILILCV